MKQLQIYTLTATRVLFGFLFLNSGVTKLLSGFSAEKYLEATTYGPFAEIFQSMAGSSIVDFLVIGGEIAIGVALLTGLFMWFTAYSGSLMMVMYYFSQFPPKTGIINMHIIYILLFFILAAFEAGKYTGLQPVADKIIRKLIRK